MSQASPHPRGARWLVSVAFVSVAFVFLGLFVARDLAALRAHPWVFRPTPLFLSIALHAAGLAWGVRVWQLLLRRMEVEVSYLPLARVWFLSALGRYIPGKIWQFVGAAHLGTGSALAPAVTVTSLAAHTGLFLVAASLIAVYLLPLPVGQPGSIAPDLLRAAAPLLVVLVHPALIRKGMRTLRRFTGRAALEWNGKWGDGIWLLLLACIGWCLTGAALFLFVLSLTPLPSSALPALIGMNALAFLVGYLVFIAPAGLGAKEGALAALLTLYVSVPVAALLAVAARLWTVIGEVLPALALLRAPGDASAGAESTASHRGGR